MEIRKLEAWVYRHGACDQPAINLRITYAQLVYRIRSGTERHNRSPVHHLQSACISPVLSRCRVTQSISLRSACALPVLSRRRATQSVSLRIICAQQVQSNTINQPAHHLRFTCAQQAQSNTSPVLSLYIREVFIVCSVSSQKGFSLFSLYTHMFVYTFAYMYAHRRVYFFPSTLQL